MKNETVFWDVDDKNFCLWDWNLESGTIGLSSNWFDILGLEESEYVPSSEWFNGLVHPDDLPILLFKLEKNLSMGQDNEKFFFRLKHKEYGYLDFQSQGIVVLQKPDGTPGHVIWASFFLDTTTSLEKVQ